MELHTPALISMLYNSSWRSVLLPSFYFQKNGATERLSGFLRVTQPASAKPGFELRLPSAEPDALSSTPCRLALATQVAEQGLKLPVPELLPAAVRHRDGGRGRFNQTELPPFAL